MTGPAPEADDPALARMRTGITGSDSLTALAGRSETQEPSLCQGRS